MSPSATPATQNARRCHQVPHLPRKVTLCDDKLYLDKLCLDKLCVCVSKLCVDNLCGDKLCVDKLCV